jgi:hypothetical protein
VLFIEIRGAEQIGLTLAIKYPIRVGNELPTLPDERDTFSRKLPLHRLAGLTGL